MILSRIFILTLLSGGVCSSPAATPTDMEVVENEEVIVFADDGDEGQMKKLITKAEKLKEQGKHEAADKIWAKVKGLKKKTGKKDKGPEGHDGNHDEHGDRDHDEHKDRLHEEHGGRLHEEHGSRDHDEHEDRLHEEHGERSEEWEWIVEGLERGIDSLHRLDEHEVADEMERFLDDLHRQADEGHRPDMNQRRGPNQRPSPSRQPRNGFQQRGRMEPGRNPGQSPGGMDLMGRLDHLEDRVRHLTEILKEFQGMLENDHRDRR